MGGPTEVSRPLTYAATIAVMATSSLFVVTAFFGFLHADELRSEPQAISAESDTFLAYSGWLSVTVIAFIVAGVLLLTWTARASRVLDARGATGRPWRGAWTVVSWLIPLANLVLPKLVYNELERGFAIPYRDAPLGEAWRSMDRTTLADAWWALWIAGFFVSQAAGFAVGPEGATTTTDEQFALTLSIISASFLVFAAAGFALLFVVRRIAVSSTA